MNRPGVILLSGAVVLAFAASLWFAGRDGGLRVPDEKRVAMELLQDRQNGPGYFHAPAGTAPDEQGILWLSPDDATAQLPRVIEERNLPAAEEETLGKLIRDLTEAHPSRAVGGSRINLPRLNVALDALIDSFHPQPPGAFLIPRTRHDG